MSEDSYPGRETMRAVTDRVIQGLQEKGYNVLRDLKDTLKRAEKLSSEPQCTKRRR